MILCVRMSTFSCCARSCALRSGRTPKAMMMAPDAEASKTSFSVTAPTPALMVLSFTWSVESFGSISCNTSAEPCTSAYDDREFLDLTGLQLLVQLIERDAATRAGAKRRVALLGLAEFHDVARLGFVGN